MDECVSKPRRCASRFVTEERCYEIANQIFTERVQILNTEPKSRIQKAMEKTTLGKITYKYSSIAVDKVIQAGGWVAAVILLIAG